MYFRSVSRNRRNSHRICLELHYIITELQDWIGFVRARTRTHIHVPMYFTFKCLMFDFGIIGIGNFIFISLLGCVFPVVVFFILSYLFRLRNSTRDCHREYYAWILSIYCAHIWCYFIVRMFLCVFRLVACRSQAIQCYAEHFMFVFFFSFVLLLHQRRRRNIRFVRFSHAHNHDSFK